MITPFILDKEIFDCNIFKNNLLISDSIVEDWERFGIFIFQNNDKVLELSKKINDDFPVKYKQKWKVAISHFPKYIADADFISEFTLDEKDEYKLLELSSYAETVFLSSENFQLLKESFDFSILPTSFELMDYQSLKRSKNFESSKLYSAKQIEYRENNQKVLGRLKNILKYTKELVLVDRYLFKKDFDSAYDQNKGTSVLKKIFKYLLDENIYIANLVVVSSNKDLTRDNLKQLLKDILSSNTDFYNCFSKLKFIMREDSKFSQTFHDRILRTTFHYVEFGAGIVDALETSSTERFMTFNCKSRTQVDYKKYFTDISIENTSRYECILRCSKENPL
ncbi:hypothetical protein [Acinetobacter haemolyticus]|uniref:hypothetical protein n=1 Tax=Acinetobacter haemolyticus TaxID=29430 RepID=UPI003F55E77C